MSDLAKTILISIGIGLLVLLTTTFLSETLFGDLTNENSWKPLWVAGPALLAVAGYLIYKTSKEN